MVKKTLVGFWTNIYNNKTLEGTFAFLLVGLLIVCFFAEDILVGFFALTVSSLVELFSKNLIDDNFSVPIVFSVVYYSGILI